MRHDRGKVEIMNIKQKFADYFKKKDGATAVEFSLVAIPFVFAVIGVIEVAMMFLAATLVEGSNSTASRMIKTCQLQNMTGDLETIFREEFCDHAVTLHNCVGDLFVEVITMPDDSFTSVENYPLLLDEDDNPVSRGFDAGDSSKVVLIRTGYDYKLLTPFLGPLLGGPESSKFFMSTNVLQVEPCDFGGEI